MARTDTLTNFLTDVATAIKTKKGDDTPILASNFDTEIANLPGGGTDLSEYFVSEITHNTSSGNKYNYLMKKNGPISISSSVTSLKNCFDSLIIDTLDVSQMDMSNIGNVNAMFANSSVKEIIGFNNWDTSNIVNFGGMFQACANIVKLDLSSFTLGNNGTYAMGSMFNNTYKLSELDISNMELNKATAFTSMFSNCGSQCLQSDGAYANGIPYVYVKDATQQNWVLTQSNGHPSTWSTNNVIIKSNQ